MSEKKPYNPLEKVNLAESIVRAILETPAHQMSDLQDVIGAGVYIIYYIGDFPAYSMITTKNANGVFTQPIYIGKAIPSGGRKGGMSETAAVTSRALRDRLFQHLNSISEALNLNVDHFYYRSLIVDDIWIPLGENMLIEQFKPVWNRALDGFGNKDPGNRRATQYRSPWDVVHPGRKFADKLAQLPKTADQLVQDIQEYLLTGKVSKRLREADALGKDSPTEPIED